MKDDADIQREIGNTYSRTNVTTSRFGNVPSMLNCAYSEVIAYVYMVLHSGLNIRTCYHIMAVKKYKMFWLWQVA